MPSGRNLILTGFMGTGKTTVGRELADRLGMGFIDTDDPIEARYGPIPQIFAERGEPGFREIEREVARELEEETGVVIATGGRMVLDSEAFLSLNKNGLIFCLVASPETIHQRVTDDDLRRERPLLQVENPRQRIDELMAERRHEYERFQQVSTDSATPGEVADKIVRLWTQAET